MTSQNMISALSIIGLTLACLMAEKWIVGPRAAITMVSKMVSINCSALSHALGNRLNVLTYGCDGKIKPKFFHIFIS